MTAFPPSDSASEQPAYRLRRPERVDTAVLFASPHSGREYPQAFRRASVLDLARLRSSEDAFVDRFIEIAPKIGAVSLSARYPRAYVDLNRSCADLDSSVIAGLDRQVINGRVAAGLGVIPRVVAGGRAIYRGKITRAEAEARLDQVWHPYHAALGQELAALHRDFGRAILLDMHSMPSEALEGFGSQRPDIVLGDRHGGSAAAELTRRVEQVFTRAGLNVRLNSPFAGAHIVQAHGRPMAGRHAIQIEINRGLYLDEGRVTRGPNFAAFAQLMDGVVTELADLGRDALSPGQDLAAE